MSRESKEWLAATDKGSFYDQEEWLNEYDYGKGLYYNPSDSDSFSDSSNSDWYETQYILCNLQKYFFAKIIKSTKKCKQQNVSTYPSLSISKIRVFFSSAILFVFCCKKLSQKKILVHFVSFNTWFSKDIITI